MSFFKNIFKKEEDKDVYKSGLEATRQTFGEKLMSMFRSSKFDDSFYDELLTLLIQADVSVKSSQKIIRNLRKELTKTKDKDEAILVLKDVIEKQYGEDEAFYELEDRLNVFFILGVNGSGKTTTCAKLAHQYKELDKKVLLIGGDTFRAAGANQLKVWADNIGVDFFGGDDGEDPASVYVKGIRYAKEGDYDLVICDSAGRLQNKVNLMNELEKMRRVLIREAGQIDKTYLVIDGNTGQNGISQAKNFTDVAPVDSLIVTKLDGSPKGGVLLSIKDELGIKVSHIGLGESLDDLRMFNITDYLDNLVDYGA